MDKTVFEKYKRERYEGQIAWYSEKASLAKRRYTIIQWEVIILSASLPALTSLLSPKWIWIATAVSVLLAIGTTAMKAFKFQEDWINYRATAETLKKERYYYEAELDEYGRATDKEAVFVERVEKLISRENSIWIAASHQKEKPAEPAAPAAETQPAGTDG